MRFYKINRIEFNYETPIFLMKRSFSVPLPRGLPISNFFCPVKQKCNYRIWEGKRR